MDTVRVESFVFLAPNPCPSVFHLWLKTVSIRVHLCVAFLCVAVFSSFATDLERDFRNPPASARPRTLWQWMNGNVTADGITRDLEAIFTTMWQRHQRGEPPAGFAVASAP